MHTGLAKFFSFRRSGRKSVSFPELFAKFQAILDQNNRILDLVAGMGDKLGGEYIFDRHYIETATDELVSAVADFIADFCVLTQKTNKELVAVFETVLRELDEELTEGQIASAGKYVFPLQELRHDMSEQAGTKMANLGDVSNRLELSTPDGFVITSRAFREFLHDNDLLDLSAEIGRAHV
jgi:pyruvate,water dikinase